MKPYRGTVHHFNAREQHESNTKNIRSLFAKMILEATHEAGNGVLLQETTQVHEVHIYQCI